MILSLLESPNLLCMRQQLLLQGGKLMRIVRLIASHHLLRTELLRRQRQTVAVEVSRSKKTTKIKVIPTTTKSACGPPSACCVCTRTVGQARETTKITNKAHGWVTYIYMSIQV